MYNVEEEKTCSLGSIQVGSGGDGDGSRSVGVRVLKGRTSDLLANAGRTFVERKLQYIY